MSIQVQIKVLPNPSGEVVRVSAGGRNLVGGTEMDSTVVEINPGDKLEVSGEIEERVVLNPGQFAATKVPVHDVDGAKSFAREEEERRKLVEEENKKQKEELEKKWKESREREDKRLGRKHDEERQQPAAPTGGQRVAGNVVGSKEVRDEPAEPSKPKK
jgi:hypothetical protein